ncbi:hypothetical protein [Thermosulfurimonas sp.]|uniref:hypothetical protein n=1 Tax=Thermosulfurimonas sp. TaxID=2080236 RepID=UPI0025CCFE40|nr:hypothetical protein [Thermosulfurimonas sp.]
MAEERKIQVDEMGLVFGKTMIIFTVLGVIMMVIPAILYFLGIRPYIPLAEVSKYWTGSAAEFWRQVKGFEVHGYGWIFKNLGYMDTLSMLGVLLLMITPLISMLAAVFKAPSLTYRILLLVGAAEFIISLLFKTK